MNDEPRAQLVRYYRWLHQHGLNDSHSGNGSVRCADRVWTTPSGCCAETLAPGDLVENHISGRTGEGASLDAPLHLAVYRANPAAIAVLHCHAPHTVALTLNGEDFAPADFEGQLYFASVPVLTIPYGEYLARSPEEVAAALAKSPVAVVRGHGVYAWGETVEQAYKWSSSVELSAKTAFIARLAGTL